MAERSDVSRLSSTLTDVHGVDHPTPPEGVPTPPAIGGGGSERLFSSGLATPPPCTMVVPLDTPAPRGGTESGKDLVSNVSVVPGTPPTGDGWGSMGLRPRPPGPDPTRSPPGGKYIFPHHYQTAAPPLLSS